MSEAENKELWALLIDRIQRRGRISFAEFMDLVLYHPEHGYYSSGREKIGPAGDYYTSPSVHPVFGKLIARQLYQMWEILGLPPLFHIIEAGAGKGLLCLDILNHLREFFPRFFEKIRYLLNDRSPMMGREQKAILKGFSSMDKIQWVNTRDLFQNHRNVTGCFLSNELFDSFPVHVVQRQGGRLREVYLILQDHLLCEVLGDPSTPALTDYLQSYGYSLEEGQRAEINLQALTWIEDANRVLERGFILTIDYGLEARELYDSSRREGTLLSYFRHTATADLYRHIGRQDITAHVNFTALIRKGEEFGLQKIGFTEQFRFLLAMGLLAEMEEFEKKSDLYPAAEFLKNKLAMKSFLIPGGMGTLFKVLVQGKNIGRPKLLGFEDPLPRKGIKE